MRDQGRLIEWFDDQGYGFIQPNDTSKARVFLHVKDFSRQGPRPILGCALEYKVVIDDKGRYRANQVVYLKASQTQPKKAPVTATRTGTNHKRLQPMQILIAAYIIAVGILVAIGKLSNLLHCLWC